MVEKVTAGLEADKADMQVGDLLLRWSRGGKNTEIESPFDLPRIETEEAPWGVVEIEGLRNGAMHTWPLRSYGWGLFVRPNMQGELLRLYLEGQTFAHSNQLSKAIESWRGATIVAQESGVSWLAPWLLGRTGQWLFWGGRLEIASKTYQEAIQLGETSGPVVKADLFWQWASRLESTGDMATAAKRYEDVLSEWKKLGPGTIVVAASYVDLGRLALREGDLTKAEECFRQILAIREKMPPDSVQTVVSIIDLGLIFEQQGDLAKAEEYYRNALAIERTRLPRSANLVQILSNFAALADQRGDLAGSELYYRKALAVAEQSFPGSRTEADVLDNLAARVADRGHPAQAEKYQKRALAIRTREFPGSVEVASSLAGLGRIARVRGDLKGAVEYYRQALAIGEKLSPPPIQVAYFFIGAGDAFREKHDLEEAANCYRRAVAIMEKSAPGSVNQVNTLASLAGIMRQQGQLDAASQLYERAFTQLESMTTHLGGMEEDRVRYRANHMRYYREYIDLLVEQGQPELAFHVLERSRARGLLETLAAGHVDISKGVDPNLLTQRRRLEESIRAVSDRRLRPFGDGRAEQELAAFDKEIEELLRRYHEIEERIRSTSPVYAGLTQPEPLSAREVQQQLLDPNILLLEYCLGEEHSYVFAVTSSTVAAYRLPKRTAIETTARHVYTLLTTPNGRRKGQTDAQWRADVAQAATEYPRAAAQLSQMILGPLSAKLKDQRLLVVADGALQYIPFAALPSPGTSNPLVLEHEIINLPSATALALLRKEHLGRRPAANIVAVLADPVFDARDSRVQNKDNTGSAAASLRTSGIQAGPQREKTNVIVPRAEDRLTRDTATHLLTRSANDLGLLADGRLILPRLRFSRHEADAILAVTPHGKGKASLDFEASRSAAMSPELANYRIVHFATHGLLNSKHPELSGLVFSLVDRDGKPQNGFLQLQDIYNLNLPAELVVLSACETGLGQDIQGEGLVGLTRGFMYAGVSRVMASSWKINDAATSELMAYFYESMEKKGMRPAAALRHAQIQMSGQKLWHSPYYWAAFQIQGEWK